MSKENVKIDEITSKTEAPAEDSRDIGIEFEKMKPLLSMADMIEAILKEHESDDLMSEIRQRMYLAVVIAITKDRVEVPKLIIEPEFDEENKLTGFGLSFDEYGVSLLQDLSEQDPEEVLRSMSADILHMITKIDECECGDILDALFSRA